MLNRIDEYLIDRLFQAFAHRIQRNIGLDCFFWGEFFFFMTLLVLVFCWDLLVSSSGDRFIFGFLFFMTAITIVCMRYGFKNEVYLWIGEGYMNSCRVGLRPARILGLFVCCPLCLVLFLLNFIEAIPVAKVMLLLSLFFVAGIYFYSCNPLSPSETRNKIKEWLFPPKLVEDVAIDKRS